MRIRRTVAATSVLALTLLATACGGSSDGETAAAPVVKDVKFEAGTTMEKLSQAKKITIGTKFDQPLFGLKGLSGKPEGFDVEISKIIAGELGIPAGGIAWTETPSKVREEKIEQGAVDLVLATYTINDKRKERVTFGGPYYEAGQDLMVKKDDNTITGPQSLKAAGAKVCSVVGSASTDNVKPYVTPGNQVTFDVYSKCADALRTGQVQAVSTDNVILLGLIDQNKGQFKLVGKTFTKEPYGIGMKKGDVKFCEFVNSVLTKAVSDGRYEQAWKDTAGKVSEETAQLPSLGSCS